MRTTLVAAALLAATAVPVFAILATPASSGTCTPPAGAGPVNLAQTCPGMLTWAPLALGPTASPLQGFQVPEFRKVADEVCLRGGVGLATGSDPQVLGTLPADFRPPARVAFATAPTHASGTARQERVDVYPGGEVMLQFSEGDHQAFLDGICFSTFS